MLKIYLARHGQDEDNAQGILNGHRDRSLTELGIKQAQDIANKIKDAGIKFDAIYSSPLKRTLQTASIIVDAIKAKNIIPMEDLIERNYGVMTGKLIKDIEKFCAPNIIRAESINYFLCPEGAETFPDLLKRSQTIINFIKENHKDGSILLITSSDIGKMIYASYYNIDWKEILSMFHFGNSELLIISEDTKPEESHVFKIEQYN